MENKTIVIDYKHHMKTALFGFFSSAVFTAALIMCFDQLKEVAVFMIAFAALLWMANVGMVLMSRNEIVLDAEGITQKTVFGTKTCSWAEVREFGRDWTFGNVPVVILKLNNPKKTLQFAQREDVFACACQYYGKPDYDKYAERNKL